MLRIEDNLKEDISFFRQLMNVLTSARKLAVDPNAKISDYRKSMIVFIIFGAAVSVLVFLLGVFAGFDVFNYVAIVLGIVIVIFAAIALIYYNSMVKKLMSKQDSDTKNTLVLDKEGIEFTSGSNQIKIGWKDIKFMRIEKDVVFFFPEQYETMPVLASHARYKDKIQRSLKEDGVNIKKIGK